MKSNKKIKSTKESVISLLKFFFKNLEFKVYPYGKSKFNVNADNILVELTSFSKSCFMEYEWFGDESSLNFNCDEELNKCLVSLRQDPLSLNASHISLIKDKETINIKISFKNEPSIYIDKKIILDVDVNIYELFNQFEKIKSELLIENCDI